jgi:6-phosphogluconolactonase
MEEHVEPEVIIGDGPERTAQAGARLIADLIEGITTARGQFTFALSGGNTPRRLYEILAGPPFRNQIPWNLVHFFWGDERCVPPDHPDSNYRMAMESFLSKIAVPEQNIHRMRGEIPMPEEMARQYDQELRQFFELREGEIPSFDLALLGMGADGHTASLFPESTSLHEVGSLAIAVYAESLYSHRVTLTVPVLNESSMVLFLVTGSEKAETLRQVIEGEYRPDTYPAQMINPRDRLLWLVDGAAASKLREVQQPQSTL